MSSNMKDSDGNTRVTRGSLKRMSSSEQLNEPRVDTPRVRHKLDSISENAVTPGRTRKNSENSDAGVSSPFRRTTRASSQDNDVTASPLPRRARRSLSRLINDSDTDEASTPMAEVKNIRKIRKSILNKLPIDLIEEETEIQFEDSKTAQSDTVVAVMTSDALEELELRNRSIIKSPITSAKNSANNSLNEVQEKTESLDETLEEKQHQKILKSSNQPSSENPNASTMDAYDDNKLSNELSPVKKFSSKTQTKQEMKSFEDAFITFTNESSNPLENDDSNDHLFERIDAALGNSPGNTPFRKVRSICNKKTSESSSGDIEIVKVTEDVVPGKTKTPKSSKKTDNTLNTPSLTESVQNTSEVLSQSKTPKKLMQTPEQDEVTKTPKTLTKTPEQDEVTKTPKTLTKTPEQDEVTKTPKTLTKTPAKDEVTKTPKTLTKTPAKDEVTKTHKTLMKTPAKDEVTKTPKTLTKTPEKAEDVLDEVIKLMEDFDETPKGSKKTPSKSGDVQDEESKSTEDVASETSVKTPQSSRKLKNDSDTPDYLKTPKSSKKADQSSQKTLSKSKAVNRDQTTFVPQDMDISQLNSSDMEIVLSPFSKKPKTTNVLQNITSKFVSQQDPEQSLPDSQGVNLTSEYVAKVTKRRSLHDSSKLQDTPASAEKEKFSRSWSQSVVHLGSETIDKLFFKEPKVLKASPSVSPVQCRKSISSDESEEEEKNSFVDDEAEVGSDETISESERQYLEENEISDVGESIGSQNTNEIDSEDYEDAGSDSFIDKNEISDNYSMDSYELQVEESPKKPKRKSRIIVQSESSDNEGEVGPAEIQTSPEKEAILSTEEVTQQTQQLSAIGNKKRKRDEENDANESKRKKKRAKISIETTLSGIEALFEEKSSDEEMIEDVEEKPTKPQKSASSVKFEFVLNKCNEFMADYNESKKAKTALKREKKAQKLAKKQQAAAAALPKPEGLDSSNGSNKENVLKKKKKPKVKKQKPVDEMPEKKEDLATSVAKLQEKSEQKRQRKLEKKMAKQQQQQESAENNSSGTVDSNVAEPQQSEKKAKKSKPERMTSALEPATSDEKTKKIKNKKKLHEDEEAAVEPSVSEVVKSKKNKKLDDENENKKKKKNKEPEPIEEAEPAVEEVKKKKKKGKKCEEVDEPEQAVVDMKEKKKGKKRKIEDVHVNDEDEVPKPKKKLNVLMQIEDPHQYHKQSLKVNATKSQGQDFITPMPSHKLKSVIPPKLNDAKKKHKKKKAGKKPIPEPKSSLPRPVWTSSGIFVEQPMSPFKFKSTKYVPINTSGSTKFGVVKFGGEQKKKREQAPVDFKTQAMFRNMKARDGSMKNIGTLMRTNY